MDALQDFFTMPAAKRRHDEFNPNYQNGGYIPQQDGAGDFEDFPAVVFIACLSFIVVGNHDLLCIFHCSCVFLLCIIF